MQCKELIHPFQNDPGVSQSQRVMDNLLHSKALVDGRNLADMLDYFQKLAKHINYYDPELKVSDWQSFFQDSLPFTITEILKFNTPKMKDKLAIYAQLFDKNPQKSALQLLLNFTFQALIKPIYSWNTKLKDSDLPLKLSLARLIKDKLSESLKAFIIEHNSAVKWFHLKPLDFTMFQLDDSWNIDPTDLYAQKNKTAFLNSGINPIARMRALKGQIITLADAFLDLISSLSSLAGNSLELSFSSLTEENQEKISPHLALMFTFFKLFKHVQNDINSLTKKHLDFFYKEVLLLKAKDADPDQVHLVFEIQNQIQKYFLQKGTKVKDGKDANKQEIQFALDDQIVINRTQVAELKTLFLNNQVQGDHTYLKGLHVALNAGMADGIDKPFKDVAQPSWSTLGAESSKFIDPEHGFYKPLPSARVGFILTSDVLLLQEGDRKIDITLVCKTDSFCTESIDLQGLKQPVKEMLNQEFYPINRDLIALAVKKGISKDLEGKLNAVLWKEHPNEKNITCYNDIRQKLFERILTKAEFEALNLSSSDSEVISDIIKPIKAINLAFSGEKKWLIPKNNPIIQFVETAISDIFMLQITVELQADEEAITYYNDSVLKEGLDINIPLLKVEFDDRIKLQKYIAASEHSLFCQKAPEEANQQISFYQFFRNIKLSTYFDPVLEVTHQTNIKVKVCGLKNVIVQNNESLQNVNGPIYPFGTRPEIIDFDIKNQPQPNIDTNINLIGPDFFIGSHEVFSKKWDEININLNWKDKPTNFRDYYKGYLEDGSEFGLDENKFFINLSILEDGEWKQEKSHSAPQTNSLQILGQTYNNRKLFENNGPSDCSASEPVEQVIRIKNSHFNLQQQFIHNEHGFKKFDQNSSYGFLKINLQFQDFCHKVYSYVLARQMMALGKLPESKLEDAIYYNGTGNLVVFKAANILADLDLAKNLSLKVDLDVNSDPEGIKANMGTLADAEIPEANADIIRKIVLPPGIDNSNPLNNLTNDAVDLKQALNRVKGILDNSVQFQAVIPNEPWTPMLKNLYLDYSASAEVEDIDIIHLYPFPETYKHELLVQQPSLLPTYCDEGNLFIALKDLEPGSTLSILFQLAEATADSESKREPVSWHYLENNTWKMLRPGFEVLEDHTDGLTSSGILKLAIPGNITKDNTILRKGYYWLKASIAKSSRSVSETIGIHPQAIKATFCNEEMNDKLRLNKPLTAGSIAKLATADPAIKKISQPYDTFKGKVPEDEGQFYIRVSELLKHKGRAIQKFDYERLVLEEFPELFKVKCINHSFALDAHQYVNDFPMAPGYVLMAVIPDLNKLKASQIFEPRVPVSLLENIQKFIQQRCSPFVRLRIMNPRYEGVNFCLKVKLQQGMDEAFYTEKLKQDLREFLAPWAIGKYDKLTFGQCIYQSDIVGFIESRAYVNYIIDLRMQHEDDNQSINSNPQKVVCPITPRSILIAAEIDVYVEQNDCEHWESDKRYPACEIGKIPIEMYCNKYQA